MSARDVVEALKRQHCGYFLGPPGPRPLLLPAPSPERLAEIRRAAQDLARKDGKESA